MDDVTQTVDETGVFLVNLILSWGLRLVGAAVVLVLGLAVSKAARLYARKAMESRGVDPTLVPFVSSLGYYLILVFVGLAILGLFGIETTSVIAVLGAAGLAIGLALQGTLSNFASGVMLLVFRPFRVGDFIDAGGTTGTVEAIGVFATTLNTPDNVRVIAPNASIYGQVIKVFTANATRRNDMTVAISYGDDIGRAVETIRGVLAADPRVLADPAPFVAASELAASSVSLVVRPWCRKEDYWDLRCDLTRRLKEALEAAGCTIPFPQTEVHLHRVG